MSDAVHPPVERTLGRWDLVLLKIVAIVNLNNVPATAVYGWFSVGLWVLAFVAFFVPEAIAVLVLSRRYPGEGGIYLWIRQQFGEAHGFLAGWCYWATNLFYVPVLLVYMAGIFAFAGGEARAGALAGSKAFVAALAFGWLAFMTVANVRGAAVGKWIHNIGGVSSLVSVVLVIVAAGAAIASGVQAEVPAMTGVSWEAATSFAVMCNALVGAELASTMGDEIRDPRRDLGPAIAIAGVVSILSVRPDHRRRPAAGAGERGRRAPRHHAGHRHRRRRRRRRLAGRAAGGADGRGDRRRRLRLVRRLGAGAVRRRLDQLAARAVGPRPSGLQVAACCVDGHGRRAARSSPRSRSSDRR